MNKFLMIAVLAGLSACDKFPKEQATETPSVVSTTHEISKDQLTVGTGGIVSSKNISVLVGPAIINGQQGNISFYVQKAPPFVNPKVSILTCLLFNAKNQLIVGSGANLPNKLTGGTMTFGIPATNLEGGKVTCQITES